MALVDIAKEKSNVDRTHGIKLLIEYLEEKKIDTVLDLFAGSGAFCSWLLYQLNTTLPGHFPDITHLELDKEIFNRLHDRFGRHRNNCINTNAYKFIEKKNQKYDLIFCDNGMWSHEYFNIIPNLKNIISKGWFVHNINCRPYGNFSNDSEWGKTRSNFYEIDDTSDCDPMDLLEKTGDKLKEHGFNIKYGTLFPRELYNGHVYLHSALWELQ